MATHSDNEAAACTAGCGFYVASRPGMSVLTSRSNRSQENMKSLLN